MKRIATASLETRGSMDTNSRCPPRSQIWKVQQDVVRASTPTENVISVFRMLIVFSIKLTPRV
jgi:hypothetical protein